MAAAAQACPSLRSSLSTVFEVRPTENPRLAFLFPSEQGQASAINPSVARAALVRIYQRPMALAIFARAVSALSCRDMTLTLKR